jgi:hypothetical protein
MHIRAQNAALIVRRLATADFVQFEVFEVLPLMTAVMEAEGKLLCSYPGPAIQIPTDMFTDEWFLSDLSSFLVQMDVDRLDSNSTSTDSNSISTDSNSTSNDSNSMSNDSKSFQKRSIDILDESVHPRYISELLVGILRGCGRPALVDRITKRIGDEVLLNTPNGQREGKPWRRSPLWLILRVTLQSSLRSSNLYKPFVLFFHAHLLHCGVRQDFPSELLYVMRAKMARRLSKLGPDDSHHVHRFVHDSARETEALLSKRWTTFQETESIPGHSTLQLKGLDFVADSNISLVGSYQYLADALLSASQGFKHGRFTPSYGSRLYNERDFSKFTKGALTEAIDKDPHIALADFELSVEIHLETWVAASTNNDKSLDVIASCIEQYLAGAKKLYDDQDNQDKSEDKSMMTLTIMDLWVALDRLAIQACPLLKQYSPEIPSDFLHCLLLHRSASLKRALHIEEYLCQRHKEVLEATSIFSNTVDDSCFALKYFRTSKNLQLLYDEISKHALEKQAAKRAELASLNKEWTLISRKALRMDHKQSKDKFGRGTHSTSCQKCELERRAKSLKIRVHEWILPPSTKHAQLVVFELSPPRAFSIWRDISYMIICDVGWAQRPELDYSVMEPSVGTGLEHSVTEPSVGTGLEHLVTEPPVGPVLNSFYPLRRWTANRRRNSSCRVTICSVNGPYFSKAGELMAMPVEESSLFVDNGLSFMLFDATHRSWVKEHPFSWSHSTKLCDPHISTSSPYYRIRQFVSSTQHTPNGIIAAQADCPDGISLPEFISFAGLRSGPRLQWLNIARELTSPYLSFSREEVHTLITHAAWQLGPLSDGIREWHAELSISSFGNVLLCELETLLEKTKANWQEEGTARTIGMSDFSDHHSCLICVSSYLQPPLGLDNRRGCFSSGMFAAAKNPSCDISMDRRSMHED